MLSIFFSYLLSTVTGFHGFHGFHNGRILLIMTGFDRILLQFAKNTHFHSILLTATRFANIMAVFTATNNDRI